MDKYYPVVKREDRELAEQRAWEEDERRLARIKAHMPALRDQLDAGSAARAARSRPLEAQLAAGDTSAGGDAAAAE